MTENTKASSEKQSFINKEVLIHSGIQYGHRTSMWNPKMKPYIHSSKDGVHILDISQTYQALQHAFSQIQGLSKAGGKVLFVGTADNASKTVQLNAERSNSFFMAHRWLGGTLTNWKTIQKSITRLRNLERMEAAEFKGYSKKEAVYLKKELDKLQKTLGGIKFMRRLPAAIFVASAKIDTIAIAEAKKLGIPVFGIVDTNVDPNSVGFPIPANDDANKAVALVTTIIADAINSATGGEMKLVMKSEEDAELIGVAEPKPSKFNKGNKYSLSQSKRNSMRRIKKTSDTSDFNSKSDSKSKTTDDKAVDTKKTTETEVETKKEEN